MSKRKAKRNQHLKRPHPRKSNYVISTVDDRLVIHPEGQSKSFPYYLVISMVIFWVVVIGLGYYFSVHTNGKHPEQPPELIQNKVDELIKTRGNELAQRYPQGYKIITMNNNRVFPSLYDSLPKNLHVDWEHISTVPVDLELKMENPKIIKIKIPGLRYEPTAISGQTVTTVLLKEKDAVAQIIQLGEQGLFIEILDVHANGVIYIFGIH